MKKIVAVAALIAATSANAATVILTNGNTYSQNFDTLAATGTSSIVPTGVQFDESGTNQNTTYTAGTGSGNTGDTYSFGVTGGTDRALGGLRSGSLEPLFGLAFTNSTGQQIVGLRIAYTGEQWRLGTLNRADRLDFQYAIGTNVITTGSFTDVDALDFLAPTTTGTTGALDGNAAANRSFLSTTISNLSIGTGGDFALRFVDFDATGADDGLAIDDFSLTPVFAQTTAVPEPTTWAMLISGFGVVGASMRRQRRSLKVAL